MEKEDSTLKERFTFQYGYSKTKKDCKYISVLPKFTFQYGYSKTEYGKTNLPFISRFTFQYGYSKTHSHNFLN